MGQNVVKQHIEHAEKTGVLQLVSSNIREVPADCLRLRQTLRNLNLSENKIEHVASFIGQFSNLRQLSFSKNRLRSLPDELSLLGHLETLDVSHNSLNVLPASISRLNQLKNVHLSHCLFTEIPGVLCQLPKLDLVDLSSNKIQQVPDYICTIHAIEINLNQNQISVLSTSIAKCPRLRVLRLEENCLPLEMLSKEVLADSQISLLVVEGNLFDIRDLRHRDGYDKYMDRFTATKKKMY